MTDFDIVKVGIKLILLYLSFFDLLEKRSEKSTLSVQNTMSSRTDVRDPQESETGCTVCRTAFKIK